jgi:hypothetical protein
MIHSVALGRYMSEGGLKGSREEVELMTGEYLPFAPLWIKGDSLANMFVCLFVCLVQPGFSQ